MKNILNTFVVLLYIFHFTALVAGIIQANNGRRFYEPRYTSITLFYHFGRWLGEEVKIR